ncbi:MAG TPA: hypothetical protein VFY29_15660, partial [Terriglobia bacterium]|nr:hypothetical protein [Terriglobia bacterium]
MTSADCGIFYPRAADGSIDYNNPQQGTAILPTEIDPFTNQVSWDGHGRVPDRTGYISRLLAYMPRANYFETTSATGSSVISYGAEGLNRAGASFHQDISGLNNRNTFRGGTFGTGLGLDQSQVGHRVLNIKIDHNINSTNRVSLSTSFQHDRNNRTAAAGVWPDGVEALAERVPHVMTLNGLSTLSPRMVNEARFGITFNRSAQLAPWDNPDQAVADFAKSFLQQGWPSYANSSCASLDSMACVRDGDPTLIYYIPAPGVSNGQNLFSGTGGLNGTRAFDFTSNVLPGTTQNQTSVFGGGLTYQANGSTGFGGCLNGTSVSIANCEVGSALYNFADTFSFTTGAHTFRSGLEFRVTRAHEVLSSVIPSASAGANAAANTLPRLADPNVYPVDLPAFAATAGSRYTGLMATSRGNARDLLYLLSGSVDTVNQQFWVNSVDNYRFGRWDSWDGNYCPEVDNLDKFCPSEKGQQIRNTVQNEYAFFIKDDWKLTKQLTLNLGVRYENYGNLYVKGFSTGILDAGYGLFGTGRYRDFSDGGASYMPFNFNYDPFATWMTAPNVAAGEGLYLTGYGPTPPAITLLSGATLPNGDLSYVPGFANSRTLPVLTAAANSYQAVDACVYGVQQSPLLPVSNCQPNMLVTRIFVGPDSKPKADPNAPDYTKYPATYRDRNNIGPAIGFSYRLSAGRRTFLVRGGFQFTYGSAGRDRSFATGTGGSLSNRNGGGGNNQVDQTTSTTPGTFCNGTPACSGLPPGQAFTLADLPNIVPLKPTTAPSLGAPNGGGVVAGNSSNI